MSALAWHNKDDPARSDHFLVLAHLPDPALKKGKSWSSQIQHFEFPGSCLCRLSLSEKFSIPLFPRIMPDEVPSLQGDEVLRLRSNGQRIPKPYTTQAPGLARRPIIHPACTECLFPAEGGKGHFFPDLVLPGN